MASDKDQILPIVTAQPSLGEVLQEVQNGGIPYDKFWVSCYKESEPSVHGKIHVELDEQDRDLLKLSSENESIHIDFIGNGKHGYEYNVSCPSLGVSKTRLLLPSQEYSDPQRSAPGKPQRITAFDISPDSSRFATGFTDGSVYIHPTSSAPRPPSFLPRKTDLSGKIYSRPQLSEVSTLKFFPSNRVILASGLDFTLSIVSADLPEISPSAPTKVEPVRTLRSHTRPVTATEILGVGRNVVSASLDATVKKWDVASGSVIATLATSAASLSMTLGKKPGDQPHSLDEPQSIGMETSVVCCGLQDGTFELLDLSSNSSIYKSTILTQSPLLSIAAEGNFLATGSASGLISVFDIRSIDTPLTSVIRNQASITDIEFLPPSSGSDDLVFIVSSGDGLPFAANLGPDGLISVTELIGADCDPVRTVCARRSGARDEIWLSSDDGIVRRYDYN
ncbi:WD40 repeat-like protein [Coprinopsis marcescibilis]|uniref:WD40 repeat-like protein n=1 Tax=Coprinopsis marcescibilis TaxID=230819 RepID=A0A5C3L1X3_COPMA|nr:WD40 repeat-like protein [Coprinopsis marcescibilis]